MKPKNTELQICSKLCILTSLFIVITVAEPLVSIPSRSIYNFKKIPENIFKEQGRERYSTHIQLDREIYRPGETLFWRSWIVNAFDNSPLPSSRSGSYTIEIVGPKGDVVSSEETYTCGTVDGDWVHLKYEDSGLYLSCEQSTIQLQEFKDDSTQLFRVNDNSFIECKAYPSMVVERNNNNDFMELMKENNRYIWPTTENGHRLTGDNLPFKPVTNTVGSRIRTTTRSSPVWVPYSESNWVILGRTWQIPSDLPGGNYILRIKFQDRYPVSERSFSVRSYRNPLVNFDTKFTQPGYGPSDTVVAVVKVKAADGSSLVGASLTITAQFNGDQIFSQEQQVQSYSNTISFPLPANFSTESSASITIAVNDPRLTDSSTVSVPLVLPGLLQLNFYPEGGPLVNNINNTVYFEALHSITNEPVSIEGILYENSEKILTPITTIHEGRGKFSLIPKLGAKYSVLVTKPTGTSTIFSLPEAIDNGAIIHSSSNIYGNTVDLELSLSGIAIENKGEFKVYLYKREEEIAMVTPNFVENTAKVQFTLSEKISGVLRVTLFHNNLPIAERLVFRENSKKLQIKIETIDEKKNIHQDLE